MKQPQASRTALPAVCRSIVQYIAIGGSMSALGHKRTSEHVRIMSALPPKADIAEHRRDVAKCQ
jgi:hypothetical protein